MVNASDPDLPEIAEPDCPEEPGTDRVQTQAGPGGMGGSGTRGAAVAGRLKNLRSDRRWMLPAGFVVAGILLFIAYLFQARVLASSSNGAGQALQAWNILHGNLLLRGWSLSDVSFYTTELPEYALVEAVTRLNGDTVHIAAALTYTLLVLLAGVLAKGRATGREGIVRLLVAVGIMLAPQLRFGTYLMLSGPDHIGTQVPLVLIWLVLDRARPQRWVPVVVAALLTWALIADMIVLVEGVLPLVVVCAVRMYRRRGRLAGQIYDLSLIGGALVSVGVAELTLKAIQAAGGFFVSTPVVGFATSSYMTAGFWLKVQSVLDTFGADFFSQPFGLVALIAVLHLVSVVLIIWALTLVIRQFASHDDPLMQMLAVAFVALLAAYLFGIKPDGNEIVGLLPIGAVLAGRLLAGRIVSRGLLPAMVAAGICFAMVLGYNTVQPNQQVNQNETIATWLQAHHLRYGLAAYWQANAVTVDSGGRVEVRPVRMYGQQLVTTGFEVNSTWYDANRHDATFVVWAPRSLCQDTCVTRAVLRKLFGRPAHSYHVGWLRVLVWRHENLLRSVQTLTWCGNLWPWDALSPPSATPCKP
jgi:hypothetical protein